MNPHRDAVAPASAPTLTPAQIRERLEHDVVLLATVIGDDILRRPHLVALLGDETLENVCLAYLAEHAGLF